MPFNHSNNDLSQISCSFGRAHEDLIRDVGEAVVPPVPVGGFFEPSGREAPEALDVILDGRREHSGMQEHDYRVVKVELLSRMTMAPLLRIIVAVVEDLDHHGDGVWVVVGCVVVVIFAIGTSFEGFGVGFSFLLHIQLTGTHQ
jgi:hypothetical protein